MYDKNKVKELCELTDNEYKLFIHYLNDFAQRKAGFDVSRYFEFQEAKLFTYQDLYNFAHSIIFDDCGQLFIQKGVKLLEYVESVCDKKPQNSKDNPITELSRIITRMIDEYGYDKTTCIIKGLLIVLKDSREYFFNLLKAKEE